jgi:hypothetical protein
MKKVALANAALTLPTVAVVMYGASEEPFFFFFDWLSFSVCVLAGGLLAVSWIAWGVALARSARTRGYYAMASVLGLWALFCLAHLLFGAYGYLEDLQQFERIREQRSRGPAPDNSAQMPQH